MESKEPEWDEDSPLCKTGCFRLIVTFHVVLVLYDMCYNAMLGLWSTFQYRFSLLCSTGRDQLVVQLCTTRNDNVVVVGSKLLY